MPSGDELHQAEHDAIVSRRTWERAQALLGNGTCKKTRPRNPDYLLRGLLRCACCHKALSPASTRKSGKAYRYYRSIVRDKKGKGDCRARPLPAAAIEEVVVKKLRGATAGGALAKEVLAKATAGADTRRQALAKERAALPRAVAALAAEGQALASKVYETAGPAARLLDERLQEVGAELARSERRLAEVERQITALDETVAEAEWVASVLRDFDALWDVMTPTNRYRLVHALVREVVVDEETGKVKIALADLDAETSDDSETATTTDKAATSSPPPATTTEEVSP